MNIKAANKLKNIIDLGETILIFKVKKAIKKIIISSNR